MNTKFDYIDLDNNMEYQLSRAKLREKVEKSRAKKARKNLVYKKIRKFIALGIMAVAVVGTITTAKNFKVAAVRVATNEEVQTLFVSQESTYSDVTSEKEIAVQPVAEAIVEEIVAEEIAVQPVVEEITVQEIAVQPVVETVVETVAQEEAIAEVVTEEVAVSEEVAMEETIIEEVATSEVIVESTTEENIIDDIIIYDKAAKILLNTTAKDITLTASKASDVMFKSQGGDKTEFSPWEELFGTNVYRYAGLRFNIEAKINADRMSVVSGFDNDFYVVVDNIDREGIEYTISLDVEEIMEMISQNGKTPEETKAIIEKHGDFFKQVIEDSKKDIENRISGSYINGMKTDNEFYRALNKQLSDSLNNEWKVTVLGAEA